MPLSRTPTGILALRQRSGSSHQLSGR
jgi:hypothetical protein